MGPTNYKTKDGNFQRRQLLWSHGEKMSWEIGLFQKVDFLILILRLITTVFWEDPLILGPPEIEIVGHLIDWLHTGQVSRIYCFLT